ncbi:MAG: hypothetical protein Q8P59_01380, partial [Dehalococcoidia bacterium]|nr:hypothetical protein [Dehalococcoidia bacterium]
MRAPRLVIIFLLSLAILVSAREPVPLEEATVPQGISEAYTQQMQVPAPEAYEASENIIHMMMGWRDAAAQTQSVTSTVISTAPHTLFQSSVLQDVSRHRLLMIRESQERSRSFLEEMKRRER